MNQLRKVTLPNGLRVLAEHRPGAPRTAVCVHYGVGYRSERPDREGFAHLFEHLMFRGSENLPDGQFFDHIHRLGGHANGTTHQDYTDYHQIIPAAALEQALFSEADRMRAPRFTEQTLAEQLDGIEMEIHEAVTGRPYGGFPWPLLPGVLFRRFANAHDGYGRLDRLRRTTLAECVEFFDAHYATGNAIITVVGDHPPQDVLALVERYFGDIPPRPVAPMPDLREPSLAEDRWVTCTEPGVAATAIALGHQIPDPTSDLPGYLAHAVLAEMICHQGADLADVHTVSASCGIFGPLDARGPDAFVITALVAPDAEPRRTVETLMEQWSGWARDVHPDQARAQAVRRLVTEHHRKYADMFARCRALGRLELLFGRAELLDEIPGLLEAVSREQVAAAARRLHTEAKGALVLVPGPTRTRPDAAFESDLPLPLPETSRSPAKPVRRPTGIRQMPPLGMQPAPNCAQRRDVTLAGGMRVVAVQDRYAPLVELRLRLPVNTFGWRHPEQVETLIDQLVTRTDVVTLAAALGGALEISTDGQWFDVTGYAPAAEAPGWLALLAQIMLPADGLDLTRQPSRCGNPGRILDPGRVMDDVLRRHLTGRFAPVDPGDLDELHRTITRCAGWLIAVGDIDPSRFVADAERVLPSYPEHLRDRLAVPVGTGQVVAIHHDTMPDVHLTLSAPEPAGETGDAARYLATAIVGAHHQSRLAARGLRVAPECQIHAGRDVCLHAPRVYIRAASPERHAVDAIAAVRAELHRLADVPVTAGELEPMRDFCTAQLLGAFDSPKAKADLLRDVLSAGWNSSWPERLPDLLRQATMDQVAAASFELFSPDAMTLVALGKPGPVSEVTARWVGNPTGDF